MDKGERKKQLSPLRNKPRLPPGKVLPITLSCFKEQSPLQEAGLDIIRTLGRGNYGVVYQVRHLGQVMAVKFFDKSKASDQTIISAREEARVLGCLDHESIVKLHHVDDSKRYLALFIEYFEGENLDSFRDNSDIGEGQAKDIFRQLVQGISYLHEQGFVHRDLKLSNVLINVDHQIKIIDFGFSTSFVGGQLFDSFCGTPAFMAPELAGKRQYDGRKVDIWALGVILYFLLVGKMPFFSFSEARLFKLIEKGNYVIPGTLTQGAQYLLSKILRMDPRDRINIVLILKDTWLKPLDISQRIKMIKMQMAQ